MNQTSADKPVRLMSLDAYRGFVMLAMASAGFALPGVAKNAQVISQYDQTPYKDAWRWLWTTLGYQFDHVPWVGCAFWDLIQPSFMFMVGVAMPFSYARRQSLGNSNLVNFAHVLSRSMILILLGVFLSSVGQKQPNFTFVNVLTQIGLGYAFVYLLLGRSFAVQMTVAVLVLGAYWWAFYQYPLPPEGFDYAAIKIPADWQFLTGLGAHWNKNTNFASAMDVKFLNLFPRPEPFRVNDGGYATLNFIPSAITMLFGVMAGKMLHGPRTPKEKAKRLALAGLLCLGIGLAVDGNIWPARFNFHWTLCPVVKRIWTPSWTVFSTGWTLWMLAAFYWIIDIKGWKSWAFPFVVVGMNSIAVYCMAQLMKKWIGEVLIMLLGPVGAAKIFTGPFERVSMSIATLFVIWLISWWMYRQKIFVRI